MYKLQQIVITHHFSVTVPLRKCTCSHFLLFVWGGLALGRYWAKLEHQSAQKPRGKRKKRETSKRRTAVADRDTARPSLYISGQTCDLQVCGRSSDGWSRSAKDDDVRWVSDGGWRPESCFFFSPPFFPLPSSVHRFRYLSRRAQTRRSEKRVADKSSVPALHGLF